LWFVSTGMYSGRGKDCHGEQQRGLLDMKLSAMYAPLLFIVLNAQLLFSRSITASRMAFFNASADGYSCIEILSSTHKFDFSISAPPHIYIHFKTEVIQIFFDIFRGGY
jgi:hypothetical protein